MEEDFKKDLVGYTAADLEKIEQSIKNYFAPTTDSKVYAVKFPLLNISNAYKDEKLNVNADKYYYITTDTVDNNGARHITAIKGMPGFKDW